MSSAPEPTTALLRHERAWVAGSVLLLSLLCWFYLWTAADAPAMHGMPDMHPPLGAIVLMWWLMMGAMMLPSAAPTILLYAQVRRSFARTGAVTPAPWTFLAGYMAAWLLFSVAAALIQWSAVGPAMQLQGNRLSGAVLVAVGAYQLSPLKRRCLSRCRAPAQFIARHWRPGPLGALRLGLLHGFYCVGCCWLLMALLFVGGVMNLALVALLTVMVSAEKLLPHGQRVAWLAGLVLIAGGIALILG